MRPSPNLAHQRARPTHADRGESGASLVLALAFLVVILVVCASLFQLAFAGTKSLRVYQEERTLRYGADAALEVGIQNVKATSTLGVSNGNGCSWNVPITEGGTPVIAANSYLVVTCTATTDSSGTDTDGGQKARDVSFTVTCRSNGPGTDDVPLVCGTGGTDRVVATARVRYEIDYSAPTATRSIVPKVLSWDIRR